MKQSEKIFLIDDDRVFNMINTEIIYLFDKDIKVHSYTNAIPAMQELEQLTTHDIVPDIIFLDINMPMHDGWEFLDMMAKLPNVIQKKCRVYMLTSSIHPNDIQMCKRYKIVKGFISKPLTIEHIQSLLVPDRLL